MSKDLDRYVDLIKKRLRSFFDNDIDYLQFMAKLKASDGFISGSFIAQCILGERWKGSDIDIYIPLNTPLNKNQRSLHGHPSSLLDEWLVDKYDMHDYNDVMPYGGNMTGGTSIRYIRSYKSKSKSSEEIIQFIYLDAIPEEVPEFILKNFDFSICKNIYSPNNDILCISDKLGILNKKFKFNNAGNIYSSINRMKKYRMRGFEVSQPSDELLIWHIVKNQSSSKATDFYIHLTELSDIDNMHFPKFPDEINTYDTIDNKLVEYQDKYNTNKKLYKFRNYEQSSVQGPFDIPFYLTDGKHRGHGACQPMLIILKKLICERPEEDLQFNKYTPGLWRITIIQHGIYRYIKAIQAAETIQRYWRSYYYSPNHTSMGNRIENWNCKHVAAKSHS
jgi:hypothetical protein